VPAGIVYFLAAQGGRPAPLRDHDGEGGFRNSRNSVARLAGKALMAFCIAVVLFILYLYACC